MGCGSRTGRVLESVQGPPLCRERVQATLRVAGASCSWATVLESPCPPHDTHLSWDSSPLS